MCHSSDFATAVPEQYVLLIFTHGCSILSPHSQQKPDNPLTEMVDMSLSQTKGQLEAKIATAITQFEREHIGRGPQEVRVWILQDMILVRMKRVLTPAEQKLARDREGHRLIKEVRQQLIEGSRSILDEMILHLTEMSVVSLHCDISIKTGERIIVFTLAEDLESKFRA